MSPSLAAAVALSLLAVPAHAGQTVPPSGEAGAAVARAQEPIGPQDNFVDKAQRWARDSRIVERLNGDIDGWYPKLGGITRGSGFALGPGYRTHLIGDRVFLDLSASLSLKGYKALDGRARWLQAFDERVELWTDVRYEDLPQEDFFGPGFESSATARTSYALASTSMDVRGVYKPVAPVKLGVAVGYVRPRVDAGTDEEFPSIEQLFTDADAPGLLDRPNFGQISLFTEVDRRDVPGNPRSGGYYRASYSTFDDRSLDQYDFRRFEAGATQFVPLVASKAHVIAGRVGMSYVNNATGHRVPFYYLAYVGGIDTIRSYREFRFQDENAFWVGAEYLWTPVAYVSVATFVDAGEVRADWQDIGGRGLKRGYGVGFRVHSPTQTFLRFDVGTGGGEGWRAFVKFGPSSMSP